jgi:hypothetical protein
VSLSGFMKTLLLALRHANAHSCGIGDDTRQSHYQSNSKRILLISRPSSAVFICGGIAIAGWTGLAMKGWRGRRGAAGFATLRARSPIAIAPTLLWYFHIDKRIFSKLARAGRGHNFITSA